MYYVYLLRSIEHPDQRYTGFTSDMLASADRRRIAAGAESTQTTPLPDLAR
jgi:hypothetical protein